jgi:DNA-binding LacI/PurR family transcriptional regulator
MELLPKRTSLVPETAAVLKQWIASGLLSGMLPGEMQLKARLGVGRDTLRLALKQLEREGFVTPASQGRHRQVHTAHLPVPDAAISNNLPVTFLSPFHTVDRITLLEMEDLQRHLGEQGRELQFLSPDIFNLKNPSRQLNRIVHEHRSAAWILYMVGEAAQQWFDKNGVPAFVYGAPFEGVKLPYTVNDWEAAAFHAGIQLFRHKHRQIGVFEEQALSSGFLSVERGLNRALATTESKGKLSFFKINPSPASVVRWLEQAFSLEEPPTALITTGSAQLLTCFSWMISRGIRCPADISLVSLCSDSWFDELRPPVCHYRCNSKVFARHVSLRVMELVATGRVTRKSVRVRLEYMGGATIGAAAGSQPL